MKDTYEYTILIVDDSPEDRETIRRFLSKSIAFTYSVLEAETGEKGFESLKKHTPDCILLDYKLPDIDGINFIKDMVYEYNLGDIPVILLTGQGSETIAVSSMKAGVQDYLVKDTLNSDILMRSIRYAIEKKQSEIEREKYLKEIEAALSKIKRLEGLLPICSSCKKIRDDKGSWIQIESYIHDHSEADFTHGICPECTKKLYPELYEDDK